MTDSRNPNDPSSDQPGVPPAPPAPPAPSYSGPGQDSYGSTPSYGSNTSAPYAAPYNSQGGAPAGEKKTLSLISMIAGILGVIIAWPTLGFGIIVSIAAVILGFMGKKREPGAKGYWLTGIITGFVGIALAILVIIGLIAVIAAASSIDPSQFENLN